MVNFNLMYTRNQQELVVTAVTLAEYKGNTDCKLAGLYNNRHFVPYAFDIAITTAWLSTRPGLRSHGKHCSLSVEWVVSANIPIQDTYLTDNQFNG